ncbi:cell envelope integrity protein CreD [Pontiella agarivorans]|uniref:Cell envelope integrity protein CreD n=1 Tax=Pontiella agarivorans TaxID=3038953 RepID=A0ABU5MV71_9BACT|nr:cell envelope integrity protein CreD [Pontiella agarivorans]MDZ8118109.1 cell envelope integrity protein CreD [Pontiella agarivorans]
MRKNMVLKLLVLFLISMGMLIALSSIDGLARERKDRSAAVQRNIAESYARSQRIIGPVFTVQFRECWNERKYNRETDTWYEEELSADRIHVVYPARYAYSGKMEVEERYRGIFKANIFQTEGAIEGEVVFPEWESLRTRQGSGLELLSVEAHMILSDLRGLTRVPAFFWQDKTLEIEPGSELDFAGSGIHTTLPESAELFGARFGFEVELAVHGMGEVTFVPVGDQNCIRLSSAWPHPSFTGDFLATERTVSENGFSAEWNVNGLASTVQQDLSHARKGRLQEMGVSLMDPVNVYSLTDRALKYGFLFIFITFAAFFLFEMLAALRIHPVQYVFVGLAQAVFFLLLLSLSEHIGYGFSYLTATVATVLLITVYLCHVLCGVGRGGLFGGLLLLLYGVLYALLQSEDHALVAGSALVFGLIALTMMLTRKVDWYTLSAKSGQP